MLTWLKNKYMRILLLFLFILAADSIQGQQQFRKITRAYFRSDPFMTSFGSFVQHLVNDPDLSSKAIDKKTDSTLFYFTGTYKTFNPFFMKPDRLDVVLEEMPVQADSLPSDTIYSYELIAYIKADEPGRKQVKKEFERIHKLARGEFPTFKHSALQDSTNGEVYNYFMPFHGLAPFSLLTYDVPEYNSICIVLIVRLKAIDNESKFPFGLFD